MASRILVVDDEPDILKVVTFRLKKLGYEVLTAIDGLEGLNSIKENKPDLVLLDFRLPSMNGVEISKTVKADEELKHIPIILLTASADNIVDKLHEANANDYMIKPFDPVKLIEKIETMIRESAHGKKNTDI